jgi:hypothetical protein
MAADRMGRGAGPDQGRCRTIPRSTPARTECLLLSAGIPNARRQSRPRSVYPWTDGAAGTVCANRCALVPEVRSELLSFPAGKHDDIVDALGLIGQLLDNMLVGNAPSPPPKPKLARDYVALEPKGATNDWIADIWH